MRALLRQLSFELENAPSALSSIFIGGGTPSCVDASLYEELFKTLRPYIRDDTEITTEANPNSASLEWQKKMRSYGVNRISFGVQSFDDKKLKLLGRAHNSIQAKEALSNAKEAGFEHISLDLIYGVANDTKELLLSDIESAFSFSIDHISAYALSIEEGTVFEKKPHMSDDNLALAKFVIDEIKKRGFEHYEISSFGTYKCLHNRGYWEYREYIGVGAGAVGMRGGTRYYPNTIIEEYIADPLHHKLEALDGETQNFERLFLALRSCVGIEMRYLNKEQLKRVRVLLEEGKIYQKNDKLYTLDYLLADEIALFIS